MRWLLTPVVIFLLTVVGLAQSNPSPPPSDGPGQNQAPPRSEVPESGESSSRDTRIDISPPKDDSKNHPGSGAAVSEAESGVSSSTSDVQEVHPWNPYRAVRDDDVGDYYFKRKNYRAALARYQDALIWKEGDAVANFGMAQCYEKLDDPTQAAEHYHEYLKILPNGPFSKEARKALKKLQESPAKGETKAQIPPQP